MDDGLQVRWKNDGYRCYKDTFQSGNVVKMLNGYLVADYGKACSEYRKTFTPNGDTIGIFHRDNIGMNLDPADCYIKEIL
jgi:hypothetical protein